MYRIRIIALMTLFGGLAASVQASPTPVTFADFSDCDQLFFPSGIADELGTTPVFPPDEFIMATSNPTTNAACPANDDAVLLNTILILTNGTNYSFTDMHYVADPGTTFSNFDGFINGQIAVRLDSVGVNAPVIYESNNANDIFEPGETWEVILNDWTNTAGGQPEDLGSIGVPSSFGLALSTGSIVALPVPEPAALGLMLPMLLVMRRRAVT